jgi:hypothetical protein
MPADGAWVEYAWTHVLPGNTEEHGILRFSSVGRKEVKGAACRWIEIKVQVRRGDKTLGQIRKLLVPEEAFRKGLPLDDIVVECFHREVSANVVTRLSPKRLREFLWMGFPAREGSLRMIRDKENVTSKLGTFLTRHVATDQKSRERTRVCHTWLTDDVPFGWAKLEIREPLDNNPARVVFTATATRKGRGATSEVDEGTAQ